MAETYNIML